MAPTVPIDFVGQKESKRSWFSQPMGKSRKYSKGHSSGFVPDYRHAVETMGESEGFGSSERVDTELTVSEDSFAPKVKCISLNNNVSDCFGVPMQVLSFSNMSRFERKNLKSRLKWELEQIRILQRKGATLNASALAMSPTSDIRSCSDGQKRPVLGNVHRSIEVSAPQSKRRAGSCRNGARTRKTVSGHYEAVKQAAPMSISSVALMKQCENILDRLMSHSYGWVFNTPVDVVKLNIPDYFNVIKHPMDLGTVKRKIASSEYSGPLEFAADVRLTFANSMKYNPPGNNVHIMAQTLGKIFESRWKAIEKKLSMTNNVESVPTRHEVHMETESVISGPPLKKKKTAPFEEVKTEKIRPPMSVKEKQRLSMELESLLAELPESIIDFLKEQSYNADQTSEDEIEIDIDALSDETLYKLRKLLDDYFVGKQNKQALAEPCEMEVINESNLSNSSLQQTFRGNEPVDEDIDVVGGNEPPISSYPPVQIEKDAARRNKKVSSSNSSSRESSSSSSDSGSSSGSESKAAKASLPGNLTKEDERSGDNISEKRNGPNESAIDNRLANELASEYKPTPIEVDVDQEGECAPPERQVSPDKLYRAALLRSRFADTILKAREKALEKGEKKDPEKLRMEKEELERRQKEEKARLQAEARAAEEARRRAEAEAAAEAKRKREMEREAARQALLQMEKTVDINENSQLMEDLEMLRTAQDEEVAAEFQEETSPELSQNGLGSFKLKGNNPLEQLGLFMKEEDDEEEEVELPKSISDPVDVEEGEID